MKEITKTVTDTEIKSIDEKKRVIWHKITKEVKDRLGDIVRIDGLQTANFKKKPTVLYGHMYAGLDPLPVVGENVGFLKEGKKLYAGTKFLNPEKDSISGKLADLVNDLWILNKKKLMGWSIGFLPFETENLKEDGRNTGKDYKRSELLEYSNVIIPAHQDAVNDAISKGIVTNEVLKDKPIDNFYYKEIEEDKVDPNKLRYATRLLALCKYKLNGPDFWIQWFIKCSPDDVKAQGSDHPFWGQIEDNDLNKILIRADAPLNKIRIAIPHECYHQSMSLKGGFPKTKDEYDLWEIWADNFAETVLNEIREIWTNENGSISWPE